MAKTTTSNGYGSWKVVLQVIVDKPFDDIVKKDGWEMFRTGSKSTTFLFYSSNRRKSDDETAVFDLGHCMPKGVPLDAYSIDWDNSTY